PAAPPTSGPAATPSQPYTSTRQATPYVPTTNCGTTCSPLVACTRQSAGCRYGDPAGSRAPPATACGGSARNAAASTAASRLTPAQTSMTPEMPYACATGGSVNPAPAMPSVYETCRTPIATPRPGGSHQPRTIRPPPT